MVPSSVAGRARVVMVVLPWEESCVPSICVPAVSWWSEEDEEDWCVTWLGGLLVVGDIGGGNCR